MTLFIHVVANLFIEILLFLIQEALIRKTLDYIHESKCFPPQKKTIKKISLRTKPSTQPSHEVVVEDP
jgi:hypothetical protein